MAGRTVNLGFRGSAARVVAREVLTQAGLEPGLAYVETNRALAELIDMPAERLPDVVVVVSFAPSYVADFLVKARGYHVLELPFSSSLALRYGWVSSGTILAYTYSIRPPIPERDISTIGVKMHVVANKNVNPKAIEKLLEVIYGAGVQSRLRIKLDERDVADPSGYPLSAATLAFMERNHPLFSIKLVDQIQSWFGLAMTLLSAFIIMLKWLSGKRRDESDDDKFRAYLSDVAGIEARVRGLEQQPQPDLSEMRNLENELSRLKEAATAQFASGRFKDNSVFERFLVSLADTRSYLHALMARVPTGRAP
jgi:hypothetical protein